MQTEIHHDASLIPLDLIVESPLNPRRGELTRAELEELKDSIGAVGLLHPLLLRSIPDAAGDGPEYELLAGRRRLAAMRELGWQMGDAIVRNDLDEDAAREAALEENLQRQDLAPLEEAAALSELVEKQGAGPVADRIGRSVRWVMRRANLLRLSPKWRKAIDAGKVPTMTAEHLETVAVLGKEHQDRILDELERGVLEFAGDVESFRLSISDDLHELAKVPWKLDDAELLPEAGACTTCTKNTSVVPDLFDGVVLEWGGTAGRSSSKARCTDEACWKRKACAVRDTKLAAAREKYSNLVLVAGDGGLSGERDLPLPKGVTKASTISGQGLQKAKKSDSGSLPVFRVSGYGAGGSVEWMKAAPWASKSTQSAFKAAAKAAPAPKDARRVEEAKPAKLKEAVKKLTPAAARAELAEKREQLRGRRMKWCVERIHELLVEHAEERDATPAASGPALPTHVSLDKALRLAAAFGVEGDARDNEWSFGMADGGATRRDLLEGEQGCSASLRNVWCSAVDRAANVLDPRRTPPDLRVPQAQEAIVVARFVMPDLDLDELDRQASEAIPEPMSWKALAALAGEGASKSSPTAKSGRKAGRKARDGEPATCRECGCTDDDCGACIERTGEPCTWAEEDLCSACVGAAASSRMKKAKRSKAPKKRKSA